MFNGVYSTQRIGVIMQIIVDNKLGMNDEQFKRLGALSNSAVVNFTRDGYLTPVCLINNSKENKTGVVVAAIETQKEKELFADALKNLVRQHKADSTLFMIESYTIPPEFSDDFMNNRDKYPTVSSHPNAQDIIYFSFENKKGTWAAFLPYDPKTKKILGQQIEFKRADSAEGILANLINIKEVLH